MSQTTGTPELVINGLELIEFKKAYLNEGIIIDTNQIRIASFVNPGSAVDNTAWASNSKIATAAFNKWKEENTNVVILKMEKHTTLCISAGHSFAYYHINVLFCPIIRRE